MYVPGSAERASSLDHLCSQKSPGLRGQRSRYAKNRREAECDGDGEGEEGLMSPTEEDGGGYGAFTLPCRRSHCLSEGLAGLGIPAAPCPAFQGRRAQTTQVRSHFTEFTEWRKRTLFTNSVQEVQRAHRGHQSNPPINILLTTGDISCVTFPPALQLCVCVCVWMSHVCTPKCVCTVV